MTYPPCQFCGKECLIECQCGKALKSLTRAGQRLRKGFIKSDAKVLFRQYFKSEMFGQPTAFLNESFKQKETNLVCPKNKNAQECGLNEFGKCLDYDSWNKCYEETHYVISSKELKNIKRLAYEDGRHLNHGGGLNL